MTTVRQPSFAAGEISPSMYGRVDQVRYATGLRTCRNAMVLRHGGVQNRPGTKFVAEIKSSTTTPIRLVPFIFNFNQTYALEFGNNYMRVHKNGVQQRLAGLTITDITQANPAVVTSAGHGLSNGDEIYINGVEGMVEINNRNYRVANATAANFALIDLGSQNVDSTGFGAYTTGGTASEVFDLPTPYLASEVRELQFAQSADVITIVHRNHAPRELARTGDTSWTLTPITFAPTIAAPTGPGVSGTAGSDSFTYHITSVATETFEESLAVTVTQGSLKAPTASQPHTITWVAEAAAQEYNIYLEVNGLPGFLGTAIGTSFLNDGIDPDTTDTPPTARNPFPGAGDFPGAVTYYQQRLIFASTNNNPETIYASRVGHFKNFTTSFPFQADDSVTFTLAGNQVNEIRHLIDTGGRLVVLTAGSEWAILGDDAGTLTPTTINARQYSRIGADILTPNSINGSILYVQRTGNIVRDLGFDIQVDGYRGNELTIFSSHLVQNVSLVDSTYQQTPHSVLWLSRTDGDFIGLTYIREHQVLGWHRHDIGTDTAVEALLAIPNTVNDEEDDLYIDAKRIVNGRTVHYIERMATRRVITSVSQNSQATHVTTTDPIVDSVFMDSAQTYDGRNANINHTMTLTGGPPWTQDDTLTLTSNLAFFTSGDVGNEIHYVGGELRLEITGFTSSTVVSVKPHKTVPAGLQGVAVTDWMRAVDQVVGLWNLEGREVSVFADGFVKASPNNPDYDKITVSNGTITLDRPHGVIHVGLPYISDIETLDIDNASAATPLLDKHKNVTNVHLHVEESRGIWVGAKPPSNDTLDAVEGLNELKIRNLETYEEPTRLATEVVEVPIRSEWNSNGRVFIRQIDPVPMTILSVAPGGFIPVGR